MKIAGHIAKSMIKPEMESKLVHFIATSKGMIAIDPPRLSNEIQCEFCGSKEHYTCLVTTIKDDFQRLWICGRVCSLSVLPRTLMATTTPPTPKRALLWPEFCEINGIGNLYHDVKFESINQSEAKIAYMLKFVAAPCGFILMQGTPGTGKTYAAMAMCELFTRKSRFCIFTTQKQMSNNWLNAIGDHQNNYINSLTLTPLLVIDDFGTGEVNPKFLEFFMDLINTRMQWNNRGTVITTNLNAQKLASFCGDALSDRLNTGQQFEFKGETRRKPKII